MLNYPVKTDVILFLNKLLEALQPFARAHSVLLTFESSYQSLELSYHPEIITADLTQLICRVVTFTPQNHGVRLKVNLD